MEPIITGIVLAIIVGATIVLSYLEGYKNGLNDFFDDLL
jgi:uncharacterized membrane protein